MSELLNIQDLRVSYDGEVAALRGVSLRLAAGERVGLIGPNGAGKTSLLLAILGGVKWAGRIAVEGVELSRGTLADVRGQCGMTFQDAEDQLFMPTLLEDVAFGPLNQGLSPESAEAAARRAIAAVNLAGLERRPAHHLSGGQKQQAALATILSMNVKLLLLDEPASNLDFRSRNRLIELLEARAEAMLVSSHDLDLVARLCGRTILLDEGQVVADGPTGQVLADQALLKAHGLA